MLFRNLTAYKLTSPAAANKAALEEQLSRGAFHPCGPQDASSRGWIPAAPNSDELVHSVGGQWLLKMRTDTKALPGSVVKDEVAKLAAAFEQREGYPPGRKALRELKELAIETLLPRAFVRQATVFVWIDPVDMRLVVDGPNSKAEQVIEHLRYCLDEFPLALIRTELSPVSAMADWLAAGDAPAGFTVDRDCELRAPSEEKAVVRYARHPLDGQDIKDHLSSGKLPTQLALTWDDRLSFILAEDGSVRRLAFLDVLQEQLATAEDATELFDAEFALMTGELQKFYPALIAALGGEVVEE